MPGAVGRVWEERPRYFREKAQLSLHLIWTERARERQREGKKERERDGGRRNDFQARIMYVSSLLLILVVQRLARSCPAFCNCRKKTADCSQRGLVVAPTGFPLDVSNLSMAHNKLHSLPLDYFSCYTELLVLDLHNNSLSELPDQLFVPLRKLIHLDLSYNNLSRVSRELLEPTQNLATLTLSHNPGLSVIGFAPLAHLHYLDLSHNGLTSISQQLLDSLPSTVSLRLAGNPWFCGCTLEPLLKWLLKHVHQCNSDSREVICAAPGQVKGTPLFTLTEESFKACRFSLSLDDYLFIAFVGFAVSIASVAMNFLLGITANCCHRWSKASEEEEM